jgi:hypothetical protein
MVNMITIKGTKENIVLYSCSCGIRGQCLVKPLSDGPCIVNIKCPVCSATTQVKLTNEKESGDISWACVLRNEILEYRLVRE